MCTKVLKSRRGENLHVIDYSITLRLKQGGGGRVARENRTCQCTVGGVQGEYHCIFQCDWARNLRTKYSIGSQSLEDLYYDLNVETFCDLFYDLSRIYEK